jgi:hypothetical protein
MLLIINVRIVIVNAFGKKSFGQPERIVIDETCSTGSQTARS